MQGPELWMFFILVAGVIALPGMDMAFVANSAWHGGRRSGCAAVAGMMTGGLVHVLVGAAGIAVVLSLWSGAYNFLLCAGAAYMGWIGLSLWRAANQIASEHAVSVTVLAPRRVYAGALMTCLLNPKAYAFNVAVLPAFVYGQSRTPLQQSLLLALIVVLTQAAVYGAVAMLAAAGRSSARVGARGQQRLLRTTAVLLVCGAMLTATMGWKQTRLAAASQGATLEVRRHG